MLKQRVLVYDIENSPTVVTTWKLWESNAIETLEEWYILSYSYKWLGESKVHYVSLPDFKGYEKDRKNDKQLCESLLKLFDEADIIIAHNGDNHDQKKSNSRFIYNGLTPPSQYKTIDTLKVAKRYFKFNSNSLNSIGTYLKLGNKLENKGMALWRGCMDGDMKSWREMGRYNKQDVVLLERVYLKLRPWMEVHPNLSVLSDTTDTCPKCLSKDIQRRGFGINATTKYQRIRCNSCCGWSRKAITK